MSSPSKTWKILSINGIDQRFILIKQSTPTESMVLSLEEIVSLANTLEEFKKPRFESLLSSIKTSYIHRCTETIKARAIGMGLNFDVDDIISFESEGKIYIMLCRWTEQTVDDNGELCKKLSSNTSYEYTETGDTRVSVRAPHLCFVIDGDQVIDGARLRR